MLVETGQVVVFALKLLEIFLQVLDSFVERVNTWRKRLKVFLVVEVSGGYVDYWV